MKEEVDILLKGGTIVTVDQHRRVILDGAVAVKGDRIVAVGKQDELAVRYQAGRVINSEGKVVIPGLIDTHNHVAQTFAKALVYEDLGWSMIYRIHVASEASLAGESLRTSVLLCCAQLIKSGVTSFAETTFTPSQGEGITRTIMETGMRCVMAYTSGFDEAKRGGEYRKGSRAIMEGGDLNSIMRNNEAFIQKWQKEGKGLLKPWINAGHVSLCSDEFFVKSRELADRYKSGIMTHINRDREEIELIVSRTGKRPIEHLDDLGVIGPNWVGIHVMHCSDREIQLLANRQANVAHCPLVCFDITSAVTKVPHMLNSGVNVGLGCDNVLNDLFEVMRTAFIMHQSVFGIPYFDPKVLTCEDILEMATVRGAKALNWESDIGSIEKGKKADIAIVNTSDVMWTPSYNVVGELVRFGSSRDVETVIIDGKVVMENRRLKTIDEEKLVKNAREYAKEQRRFEKARYYPMLHRFTLA